jgi:hypothetical protein
MENPITKPLNVSIKIISLDGRKLTKSIFNQIEHRRCFDHNIDFIGDELLGYVRDKNARFLVWIHQEKVRKTALSPYYELEKTSHRTKLEDSLWFCRLTQTELNENYDETTLQDRIINPEKYDQLIDKVNDFLIQVAEKQIFI